MDKQDMQPTPAIVQEMIDRVIKKMRYRKKVRADVRAELEAHFEDALADCQTPKDQQDLAEKLVEDFGDAKVVAALIRRAKKRCRPVWVKVLMRTGQVAGLCVLYLLLCLSRLMIGSPTIKVDVIAQLNEQAKQGHDETLNALPDIEKAIALLGPAPKGLRDYPSYRDMNEVQQRQVETYLTENRAALDLFRSAVQKPCYWRQYTSAPDTDMRSPFSATKRLLENTALVTHLAGQAMPQLSKYREFAFAMERRAQWYCARGEPGPALEDALAAARLGQLIIGKGLLTEQFAGVAICELGLSSVLTVVRDADVNEPLMAETCRVLDALFTEAGPQLDYAGDRAIVDDLIQRCFTDDGKGNGRPLASAVLYLGGSPAEWWKNLLLLDYPDRRQVVEHIEGFYEDLDRWQAVSPWERQGRDYALSQSEISTMYTETMKHLGTAGEQLWYLRTRLNAALTVLALTRYQSRYGRLPETLQALEAEGLVETLPRDFYSDGPLTYQRKSDADFVLYSRGRDLQDDGGEPARNAKGDVRKYGTPGDWVFWPITR